MPTLARLEADHAELRTLCEVLCGYAEKPEPPERALLTDARWRLARCLLRHLPLKDRIVYARLRGHADPAIAALAQRYSDEAAQLYAAFSGHSERWTPEAVEAEWPIYSNAVRFMAQMLHQRLISEEQDLLPHLASAPEMDAVRSPQDRNWASDGWAIRERLGVDRTPDAA